MHGDKGFVDAVVEGDESRGVRVVQDPENGVCTVITGADIDTAIFEERPFACLDGVLCKYWGWGSIL